MFKKIKAGIIGATGYAGAELVRLLSFHPHVELSGISSVSFHGNSISEIYPAFFGEIDKRLEKDHRAMLENCRVIFAALPHGLSQEIAKECLEKEIIFIDLGADFRLESEDEYKQWYGGNFTDKEMHKEAVYGLPEINRGKIAKARLVANPGCYPTSAILGLYPALKDGLIKTEGIIIDAKSGVTGAGRGLTQKTHFPECNEAFSAYSTGKHRHRPEIEQVLSGLAKEKIRLVFNPHLLPVNRGILSTIYCDLNADWDSVRASYDKVYGNETFIKVLEDGNYANISSVRLSNNCHISLHMDEEMGKLIICSAIDNMVKGAAGQAVQNMNIIMGWDESVGLPAIAPAF